MKNLFLSVAVISSLPTFALALDNNCKIKQRYAVAGYDLAEGDVLELKVGDRTLTRTINATTKGKDVWPNYMGWQFNNNIHAEVGGFGTLDDLAKSGRYIARAGENIIDIFKTDTPVSLYVNGVDQSSQLILQALPDGNYSGELDIPHFYAGTERHTIFFVSNHSDVDVNVTMELFDSNGNKFAGAHVPRLKFNGTNDPVKGTALLPANSQGDVYLPTAGTQIPGFGKIKWTSNTCVDKPLSLTTQYTWTTSKAMSHVDLGKF
ncbi:hypothetical protein HG263_13105 [Pseudoalteromonas sp. JBTF-M23]|uniref:Uncharacterized protein n=1 Tax=Pseudoalteromonas caenipelagi TaxID=2726988 RepID=A0A849VCR8_9GAMM|nr:hypothetical protein [Pseudoalteromonas caenipelagi]NOU51469.1 hypothetical protein [Pseudoalteromonas caenipelagi]